jgi:hypothetical protein
MRLIQFSEANRFSIFFNSGLKISLAPCGPEMRKLNDGGAFVLDNWNVANRIVNANHSIM